MRTDLLLFALLLRSCRSRLLATSPLPVWTCNEGSEIKPVIIDGSRQRAGIIQTPNFPDQFKLPIECVWMIDLSGMPRQYVAHIYFTQFYLSPGFVHLDSTNASLPKDWHRNKTFIEAMRSQPNFDWIRHAHANSVVGDRYIFLWLYIDKPSYKNLHQRVIDVESSLYDYGFNISYEITKSPPTRDRCSLLGCNLNGQCYIKAGFNGQSIRSFFCECGVPRQKVYFPFKEFYGPRCQYHSKLGECSGNETNHQDDQNCQNGGTCRYLTSRYVACDCPANYGGVYCHIPKLQKREGALVGTKAADNIEHCANPIIKIDAAKDLGSDLTALLENDSHLQMVKLSTSSTTNPGYFGYALHLYQPSQVDYVMTKLKHGILRRENTTRIKVLQMCVKTIALTTGGRRDKPAVIENQEFSLSCTVTDAIRPTFKWFKGEHIINPQLADRFMKAEIKRPANITVGILTISYAAKCDEGEFRCEVTDLSFGNETPKVVAHRNIIVVSKPVVEVHPLTTTLVRTEELNPATGTHYEGIHDIYCLADGGKSQYAADHYRFEWLRNNEEILEDSDEQLIEQVYLPKGSILKIGNLTSRKVNFTCVASNKLDDSNNERLKAMVNVTVVLVDKITDTCSSDRAERMWPRTAENEVARLQCVKGSGEMTFPCNPTRDGWPPMWPSNPDKSQCVRQKLLEVENDLDFFVNGYTKSQWNESFLQIVIGNIHDVTGSIPLRQKEWDTVLKMIEQIFEYMAGKPPPEAMKDLSNNFYKKCISWLSAAHIGKYPKHRAFELFSLLRYASMVFTSKLPMNKEDILVDKGTSCNNIIYVKMMRFASKMQFPKTVIKGMTTKTLERTCDSEMTVTIEKKGRQDDTGTATDGVVMWYRDLDRELEDTLEDTVDDRSVRFRRNSSLLTVLVKEEISAYKHDDLQEIEIHMTFHKHRPTENATVDNLSCASLEIPEKRQLVLAPDFQPLWRIRDEACKLQVVGRDITCKCNRPGTYALVWSEEIPGDATRLLIKGLDVISMCCGCGLTMSVLTLAVLLWQIYYRRCSILFLQLQVTLCIVVTTIIIILGVTNNISKDLEHFACICLEFFLLVALICQLAIEILLYTEEKPLVFVRTLKPYIFGFSVLIPFIFCLSMFVVEKNPCWWIRKDTYNFIGYLSFNIVLLTLYGSLYVMAVGVLKSDAMKPEYLASRLLTLQRSAWVTAAICGLNITSLVYINMKPPSNVLDYIFALPCALMGTMLFLCYVLGNDGHLKESNKNRVVQSISRRLAADSADEGTGLAAGWLRHKRSIDHGDVSSRRSCSPVEESLLPLVIGSSDSVESVGGVNLNCHSGASNPMTNNSIPSNSSESQKSFRDAPDCISIVRTKSITERKYSDEIDVETTFYSHEGGFQEADRILRKDQVGGRVRKLYRPFRYHPNGHYLTRPESDSIKPIKGVCRIRLGDGDVPVHNDHQPEHPTPAPMPLKEVLKQAQMPFPCHPIKEVDDVDIGHSFTDYRVDRLPKKTSSKSTSSSNESCIEEEVVPRKPQFQRSYSVQNTTKGFSSDSEYVPLEGKYVRMTPSDKNGFSPQRRNTVARAEPPRTPHKCRSTDHFSHPDGPCSLKSTLGEDYVAASHEKTERLLKRVRNRIRNCSTGESAPSSDESNEGPLHSQDDVTGTTPPKSVISLWVGHEKDVPVPEDSPFQRDSKALPYTDQQSSNLTSVKSTDIVSELEVD